MRTSNFHIFISLVKYKVSLAVTFTAVTSCLLFAGSFNLTLLYLALGVFVLACGASALNQYQERELDAHMERTMHRPLPAGLISPATALLISVLLIITGAGILYIFTGLLPALLGLFNVAWYNLFYTNLKKITPFAVLPGSLSGAIPALMGWTAAGGYLFDPKIMLVAFFLFIWQVPHFWLLLMKYAKEYEAAGFPSVNKSISSANLRRITFAWVVATSVTSLMFPLFNVIRSLPLFLGIFFLNIWFVFSFTRLTFRSTAELNFRKAFISVNLFMLLFLLLIAVYSIWQQ